MSFKFYDILSSIIPGFLVLLAILEFAGFPFDSNMVFAYTAISFLLGFLVNAISSWLEDIYFFTWNGNPSDCLLNGKDIWKVRFYDSQKVKDLLKAEASKSNPTNNELFSIAMRYANQENSRIEDFNAIYAFSRSLLTCAIFSGIILIIRNYDVWELYILIILTVLVIWLRCKQRAYYFAREVLNTYLKIKNK